MLALYNRRETNDTKKSQNGVSVKNMALRRDVIFKRGPNPLELLQVEIKKFNLKALNKLTIRFDPFRDDVQHTRTVANILHRENVTSKNQRCLIKTEILNDRSEQMITAEAVNGEKFIIKCANLNCLDIFKILNKHITPLAPQEEELSTILFSKGKSLKKA